MSQVLQGSTVMISGGSRGIGLAIAMAASRLGASIALIAKTETPHPKLPGTVYTAAKAIAAEGGTVLPLVGDIRDESRVQDAVQTVARTFAGIDFCVNNANAIDLSGTAELTLKRFDLMNAVNVRGTWLLTQACLPSLWRVFAVWRTSGAVRRIAASLSRRSPASRSAARCGTLNGATALVVSVVVVVMRSHSRRLPG